MESRLNPIRMLALALLAARISTTAQTVSKAGHITIIAIMPETLSLSINASSPASLASAASAADHPEVAAGVTTTWSLRAGRAQIVTWATETSNLSAPVIVATAVPVGINPFPDGRLQGEPRPHGFAIRPSTSSTQMTGTRLTDTNRRGTSTAVFPDSLD